jgi:threonine dehydrogenase-like Zn-dependent dehydrogenase
LRDRVKELTDGRGADVVIEVVGHSSALRMGFEMLRPWGIMSSVGVHNGEIPWTGNEAYGKNLRLQMGRCPVRSKIAPVVADLSCANEDRYFRGGHGSVGQETGRVEVRVFS